MHRPADQASDQADLQGLTRATTSSQRVRRILERSSRAANALAGVGRVAGAAAVRRVIAACFLLCHLDDRYGGGGRHQGRGRSVRRATNAATATFSNR